VDHNDAGHWQVLEVINQLWQMFQAKKSKMAPKLPPAEDQNHESIQFT
jgi:hypothetical protein